MNARTVRRHLFALVTLALAASLAAGPAAAAVQLVSPAVQSFTVAPGGSYEGLLLLANPGPEPASVRLYLNDYRYDASGRSYYEEPGTHPRSNAPWITLGGAVVTLQPQEERSIPFRIQIPGHETLAGTYWSVILVEPLPPDAPETPRPPGQQEDETYRLGLRTMVRYAVLMVTQVGESGQPEPSLSEARLTLNEAGNGHRFEVELANGGDRWFLPTVWMELYDQTGQQVGRFEGGQRRLLPGTSVRQTIDLGSLAVGEYVAILVLDGGGDDVYGARYTFRVTEDGS